MARPVYHALDQCAVDLLKGPATANAALVHERLANSWRPAWGDHDPDDRRSFLQQVARLAGSGAQQVLLDALQARRTKLCEALRGSEWRAKTLWRLTAGMGRASSLEIGFCWDPLLGVPRLPGSSIKGAVRSWLETVQAEPEAVIERLFGPREREDGSDAKRESGTVVFLDAHPVKAAAVELDVMTVHHKRYYEGAAGPDGTESPTPLLFLAVPAGAEWVFRILPRVPGEGAGDVALALRSLKQCAGEFGLGAKTSAGYGFFQPETVPAEPKRPAPESDQWQDVTILLNPGTGELSVSRPPQRAFAVGADAARLRDSLSEKARERLKKSRRLERAEIRVSPIGGQNWRIEAILAVRDPNAQEPP